jgi:hypothetical protein
MSQPELDWTFDHIPEEEEGEKKRSVSRRPAPEPLSPAAPQRRLAWRAWLLIGGVFALVSAGIGAYTWYGWWRLTEELKAQVLYEDDRARARDVAAVRAAQATENGQWVEIRTNEAAVGLVAPLPSPDLAPLNEPPRFESFTAPEAGVFAVALVRAYANPQGDRLEFAFTQYYRNPQPGVWERLAPPIDPAKDTSEWVGDRLRVAYPTADGAWLTPHLTELDAWLAHACARWACHAKTKLALVISTDLVDWPTPPTSPRDPTLGSYPLIFDVPIAKLGTTLRWLSPQLIGQPRNVAAEQAVTRVLGVLLLAQLGDDLSYATLTPSNIYLDVVIARAEIALASLQINLAADSAPTIFNYTPTPFDYIPPETLWQPAPLAERTSPEGIRLRLQTLQFLNFMLEDASLAQEAQLLKILRQQATLTAWLATAHIADHQARLAEWNAQWLAKFATHAPGDWRGLDGLAYACNGEAWLVRAGQRAPLPPFEPALPASEALSPDKQWWAVYQWQNNELVLAFINLLDQRQAALAIDSVTLLGWAATGEFLYLRGDSETARDTGLGAPIRLIAYAPAHQTTRQLSDEMLYAVESRFFNPSRAQLALTRLDGDLRFAHPSPVILTITPTVQITRLAPFGYFPTFTPDGESVTYVTGETFFFEPTYSPIPNNRPFIEQIALSTGLTTTLITFGDLPELHRPVHGAGNLTWAADGATLIFDVFVEGSVRAVKWSPAAQVQALPFQRGRYPLFRFSADSAWLGMWGLGFDDALPSAVLVFDATRQHTAHYWAQHTARPTPRLAWSPTGHRLALPGPAGLYVVAPETQAYTWIASGPCTADWLNLEP